MPIIGVGKPELVAAMSRLGWQVAEAFGETGHGRGKAIKANGRIVRLGDFLDAYGHDGPFIVVAGQHCFAVSAGQICDTLTKAPQDISGFDRGKLGRKTWLKGWWRFEKHPS